MQTLWLYLLAGGFLAGIFWQSFFDFGIAFSGWLLMVGCTLLLCGILLRENKLTASVALVLFAAALGIVRTDFTAPPEAPLLADFLGREIVAQGSIVDEPDEREDHAKLTVDLYAIGSTELAVPARTQVVTEVHPRRSYGDVLKFEGELMQPENTSSGDGRGFDYVSYLEKDDIRYQMFYPSIEVIATGAGNPVKSALFSLKRAFLENIQAVIPDPQASLLGGLVVGAKQSLGEELLSMFRATGLIHIVVLSGYNVTIVAEAILRTLAFLPMTASLAVGGGAIVLFAIMTGGSATIIRASIMAIIVLLARVTGRTSDMFRILLIAGTLMVAYNPEILVHDPSFQLSFLATLGLLSFSPRVEPWLSFVPEKFQLRSIAAATVSTQIFVLPWILYLMGGISLVALPVNLLVLVTIPATMLFGFIAGAIGFVSTVLSLPFAYLAHLLLTYQLWITELFASFPYASLHVETFSILLVMLCYGVYVYFLLGMPGMERGLQFSYKLKRLRW